MKTRYLLVFSFVVLVMVSSCAPSPVDIGKGEVLKAQAEATRSATEIQQENAYADLDIRKKAAEKELEAKEQEIEARRQRAIVDAKVAEEMRVKDKLAGALMRHNSKVVNKISTKEAHSSHLKPSREDDDECDSEEDDAFGFEEERKVQRDHHNEVGSDSDSDDDDYDDEQPTYNIIKGIFSAIRDVEANPAAFPGALGFDGSLSEGFVLLRLSVEQLLQQE